MLRKSINRNLKIINDPYYDIGSSGEMYDVAGAYGRIGNIDSCMYYLNKTTFSPLYFVLRDPMFDPVRETPQFNGYIEMRRAKIEKMRDKIKPILDLEQ